jgi:SAM-dependent methyltransferase
MGNTTYLLGHSSPEIQRLIRQAAFIEPATERLLRSAGIAPGMRVLDLGSGPGDVALLAAALVGASGQVVGIDSSAEVLAVARKRAETHGYAHVFFTEASVEEFSAPARFDVVIGRYVLMHQDDPATFLATAARFAKPGGVLAIHEPIPNSRLHSMPNVALWEQTVGWVRGILQAHLPSWDVGNRLIEVFADAGLPQPRLFCEIPVGGGLDAPHYAWLADLARTMLPQLIQLGIPNTEVAAIDTLETRLRAAVVEARSQVEGPAQMCAWTRV